MKILVSNHWLKKLGGSETFTFTLIEELVRLGHDVSYFTLIKGMVSDAIEQKLDVHYENSGTFDLILASHNSTVDYLDKHTYGLIIQTCHGPLPKLEQPSLKANAFVAVSKEVELHLLKAGIDKPILTIHNGINLDRFCPKSSVSPGVESVLSLSHSKELNEYLSGYFSSRKVHFEALNKYVNPQWDVDLLINASDLVISCGRGAMEAMACGRPVLIMDDRPYMDAKADGLITEQNIDKLLFSNFSGRSLHRNPYDLSLIDEAAEQLHPGTSGQMRMLAMKYFDIRKQVNKYIKYYEQIN